MQGVKTLEGELPEGQEKLAWAMRVQSTRIFKLFLKFKNTPSVAKRLFRHAGPMPTSARPLSRARQSAERSGRWAGDTFHIAQSTALPWEIFGEK